MLKNVLFLLLIFQILSQQKTGRKKKDRYRKGIKMILVFIIYSIFQLADVHKVNYLTKEVNRIPQTFKNLYLDPEHYVVF
jgi:hypothetical protein